VTKGISAVAIKYIFKPSTLHNTTMNKLSIIILLLAITKHATANSAKSTAIAVPDALHSEPSEHNETMMDRELKSRSKTKFKRKIPTSNLKIDSSTYSISVEVTDPKGIKKVWIKTKYENEQYVSHRATKNGERYEVNLINLHEGTYTWIVIAKNKKNRKKRSSATFFIVIRKWFYYRVRKLKAFLTFMSDLTLYYSLLYCSRNS
jgi:hypothetical protein